MTSHPNPHPNHLPGVSGPIRLFHYWRSTASWRVRWVLAYKEIPVEYVAVNLLNQEIESPDYLKRNPMGHVPALEVPTPEKIHTLIESTAISEWAEELRPKPALLPSNPFERARVRALCEIVNSGIQPLGNLTVTEYVSQDSEAKKTWTQHWVRRGFQAYEELVQQTAGEFTVGDSLTLSDIFLVPQCYSAIRNDIDLADYPTIARLNSRILETPTALASHPDRFQPDSSKSGVVRENELRFQISGMHCASCVATVEKAIRSVSGVQEVNISLATEDAYVTLIQSASVSASTADVIAAAVSKTGYSAELPKKQVETPSEATSMLAVKTTAGLILSSFVVFLGALHAPLWILFVISSVVQFWCGWIFLAGFARSLKKLTADMDTLVSLGTLTAYLFSTAVVFLPSLSAQEVYFEISSFLISFVLLGKFMEGRAKKKTQGAIHALVSLIPATVHVLRRKILSDMAVSAVFPGDILVIKPGERIPVDGVVHEGETSIDESMLSGESAWIRKTKGNSLSAGTLNREGSIQMKALRVVEDTLLAQIVETVRRAQATRAPIQRLADRVSSVFVPIVLLLSLITFGAWFVFSHSFSSALLSAVSVLIVSCPCALGLATPAAIVVAMGKATEKGLLIRNAEALETLGKIRSVVFDKTGTLTEGRPSVQKIHLLGQKITEELALQIAASIENSSEHLLATSITAEAKNRGLSLFETSHFKVKPGLGVEAKLTQPFSGSSEKKTVLVGSLFYLQSEGVPMTELPETAPSATWVGLAFENTLQAVFEVQDLPRTDALKTITDLKNLRIPSFMLSGDRGEAANWVAHQLGISPENTFSRVLPADKAIRVGEISKDPKYFPVLMVGDGINDAPALVAAQVSISMGGGTDVAIESSSVTLLKPELHGVVDAVLLSRRTMRTIRQNLFASFFYNALGIPIAAGVFYPFTGWKLNPMLAGAAMALSSVSVILNSLRLKRWNWN